VSTKKAPNSTEDDKFFYFEPQHNRWHAKIECSVLVGQEEIVITLCREPPEGSRPCTICASLGGPCD
jgi:hypothetical protein